MIYFNTNDHKIIVECIWGSAGALSSVVSSWQSLSVGSRVKALKNVGLFTSGGQMNSLK